MFNFLLQGKVGEMMAPVQSPEAQLLIAIQNRQQDKIRDLLEVKGVGANFANDRGVRPMHIACQTGDMRLVQRLLELGADIITADKAGNTPLHYASKGGYTEMVKMLVGQGAAVEKRNGAKLTAYDVATDHVVRQYLLPLQLRAEAGNPDYAVHTMGITSDTPRNYEQYGVPGQPNALHSQPPHGTHAPSAAGPDRMSSALGALMQAPAFAPPRPGPAGMAPPTVYPGGVSGAPPMQPGSASPPPGGGVGFAGPAAALSPPPPAMGMGALPSSAAHAAPGPALPAPPVNFAGPTAAAAAASAEASSALPSATAPEPVASAEGGGGIVTPPRPGDVASQVQTSPPVAAATANFSPEAAGLPFPGTASPPPPAEEASPQAEAGAGAVSTSAMMEPLSAGLCFPEEEKPASKTEGVSGAGGARERATPPHSGAGGGGTAVGARPFSVVPVHVQQQEGAGAAAPAAPLRPGSAAAGGAGGDPVMTNVDLSSSFQGQVSVSGGGEGSFQAGGVGAALHLPPPAHPSSAPSSGRGAPPPSGPPGAYTPGPGPHQPAAEQPQGKFKPIKPDGFHSSASDKALQRRYGHTKIVRDMGAPPTAAQLGGPQGPPIGGASYPPPMGGPPPMAMSGPPPMAGPPPMGGQQPGDGYAQPQARSQYALPQPGYYGQPYGGAGAMQPGYGQQPFAQQQQQQQPPPPPPAAHQHSAMPAYSRPPPNMNGGEGRTGSSFPSPGGYAFAPAGMGSAVAASPENESRGGGGGGSGYNVFNPSTDRVVAADSTSNAVL